MIREHPFGLDLALLLLVALQALLTFSNALGLVGLGKLPNIWSGFISSSAAIRDVYLAMLGPAAMIAGFAGVVVVFGLTVESDRFRRFRARAGASLSRTWVSSSLSGIVACAMFITAAIMHVAGALSAAPFVFELGLLILAHGAARLLWILGEMISIKAVDDGAHVDQERYKKLDAIPFPKQSA